MAAVLLPAAAQRLLQGDDVDTAVLQEVLRVQVGDVDAAEELLMGLIQAGQGLLGEVREEPFAVWDCGTPPRRAAERLRTSA
ncbi:hypothetical protein [Streptomyces sp. NPDC090021]|uniref:hypothetical protein n=1 Tax=Streptomyces sp. NPDC090021 TaxID=3365919 RepID=UPI00382CA11D